MKSPWSEKDAFGLSDLGQLVYQGRLVRAEPSLVLRDGGNTPLKTTERDFRGQECRILRVKSSGATDMKSIQRRDIPGGYFHIVTGEHRGGRAPDPQILPSLH